MTIGAADRGEYRQAAGAIAQVMHATDLSAHLRIAAADCATPKSRPVLIRPVAIRRIGETVIVQ
jgi:hypothetical protein